MKDNTYDLLKESAEYNELPSKKRAVFYMNILKNNANYYELLNSTKRYADATVNVIYFNDTDAVPILIIEGYKDKFQDFYYNNGWKILSESNPVTEWAEKGITLSIPNYLIDNFAKTELVGFFEDAIEHIA